MVGGRLGGSKRPSGGDLSRFRGTSKAHGDARLAGLSPDHPALSEARTVYPKSVVRASESPLLFPSGHHQAKIGAVVLKGEWAGLPIFTFSLEERATCPPTCHVWSQCYGNGMPYARRHEAITDEDLSAVFNALDRLCREHPRGLVLRLHVLGDFQDLDYAMRWADALRRHEALHIFGYTAWPRDSLIGLVVSDMNAEHPNRCAIRFSHQAPEHGWEHKMGATTHWGDGLPPLGIACPQQDNKTLTCGTCGICWALAARDRTIVFRGHGGTGRRRARTPE